MTQLGFVKMTLELLLTSILMLLIPATEGLRLRFIILWIIMQFWSGRYKHKALLFSDEMLLLVKSFGGFFLLDRLRSSVKLSCNQLFLDVFKVVDH
uniref:hypothetical protein n=1 Tax=Faecalibaculum rodentium TaxID=1702221 RepID=UPI0023EFBE2D